MKIITSLLISLIFLANLLFTQPAIADKPKFLKNPDYIEVTKTLNDLKSAQEAQAQTESYNPEDIQKRIGELEFQKYAIEMGINWGQCRNETGKTLAVYGPKPKFEDDDYEYQYDNGLYFLADGQTTKENWDCQGVYLPSDVKLAGVSSDEQGEDVGGPIAVKIADGTQLVVKTNSDTGAAQFSIPPTKVLKPGDVNWFIPNVSQSIIDTRVANAPVAQESKGTNLVVMTKPEKNTVESKSAPKTQEQSQSEEKPSSASLKSNFLRKR
jgi:hypothetical protein